MLHSEKKGSGVIVLTGGAGFIGSCVLSKLNAEGIDDVIVVDNMDQHSPKTGNLEKKKYREYIDKHKFLNLVTSDSMKWDVQAVIHMGACSSTTLQDADYYEKNNFEYSCRLAKWSMNHRARFIYASSAATYGDGELGYDDALDLLPRLKPLNLYGHSKHKFDLWILKNNLIDRVVGLKFFNVFGPNEYHKGDMRSVIAKAYKKVADEGEIHLFKSYRNDFADGEQKRDFIYVKDVVDVIMFFFNNPSLHGIFNVGTGEARSWNDLAVALFAALRQKPHIEYMEMPESMRPRYQYFTQAAITHLRQSGYKKNFTSLENAIGNYVSYLRTNSYY